MDNPVTRAAALGEAFLQNETVVSSCKSCGKSLTLRDAGMEFCSRAPPPLLTFSQPTQPHGIHLRYLETTQDDRQTFARGLERWFPRPDGQDTIGKTDRQTQSGYEVMGEFRQAWRRKMPRLLPNHFQNYVNWLCDE